MSGYVLMRTLDGAFVAARPSPHSYVQSLQHAKVYPTKAEAEENRCTENEVVLSVDQVMGGGRPILR